MCTDFHTFLEYSCSQKTLPNVMTSGRLSAQVLLRRYGNSFICGTAADGWAMKGANVMIWASRRYERSSRSHSHNNKKRLTRCAGYALVCAADASLTRFSLDDGVNVWFCHIPRSEVIASAAGHFCPAPRLPSLHKTGLCATTLSSRLVPSAATTHACAHSPSCLLSPLSSLHLATPRHPA